MNRGFLISFEGIDKCGKTTQINKLNDYLLNRNYNVALHGSVVGTPAIDKIGDIILNKNMEKLDITTELLLYLAARNELLKKKIEPDLNHGKVVLLDRYIDSTLAYQGGLRKINLDIIEYLNNNVIKAIIPNITFLIDIDKKTYIERIKDTNINDLDKLELDSMNHYEAIANFYRFLAHKENRFVIIKQDHPDSMFKNITKELEFL